MIAIVLNGEDFQLAPDSAPVPAGATVVSIAADAVGLTPNLLAYDGQEVRRRDVIGQWYVDSLGFKHSVKLDPSWQPVTCGFADPLVKSGGTWAVMATSDVLKQNLIVYANAKQWALAIGGFTATVAGVQRKFDTSISSLGLITGKQLRLQQANPPTTIRWQFADVGFVTIAAADFTPAAIAVADFVQATFDALDTVFAAVEAGTITDTASIDAAAWPANHQ